MAWVKSNAMPLAVGFAVGFFLAKSGGVKAAGARVKGLAS
jgi:hypothetical protein